MSTFGYSERRSGERGVFALSGSSPQEFYYYYWPAGRHRHLLYQSHDLLLRRIYIQPRKRHFQSKKPSYCDCE